MFKDRKFLSGLGFGLIIVTLLLQLLLTTTQSEPENPIVLFSRVLTIDELNIEAAKLNRSLLLPEQKGYTQAEINIIKENAAIQAKKTAELEFIENSKKTATTVEVVETITENSPVKYIGLFIEQGLNSAQVAKKLLDNGVISNEREFIDALAKQNLTGRIQFGYKEFNVGMETADIITIITRIR